MEVFVTVFAFIYDILIQYVEPASGDCEYPFTVCKYRPVLKLFILGYNLKRCFLYNIPLSESFFHDLDDNDCAND